MKMEMKMKMVEEKENEEKKKKKNGERGAGSRTWCETILKKTAYNGAT
jgi:hypothetical protein